MLVFDRIKELSIDELAQYLVKNNSRLRYENDAFELLSSECIEKPTLDIYRVDDYCCRNCGSNRIALDNMHYPIWDEWGGKYMCVDCGYFFHETKDICTLPLYDAYYRLYVPELEKKFCLPSCVRGLAAYG